MILMKQYKLMTITIIVLFILLLLTPGYASADEKTLKIDPSHVLGLVNMRSEVTSMLEDLGYEWTPILNDSTQQKVKVAEKYGQYRMLFKAVNNDSVQIELHIRQNDNMTGLHFSEIGSEKMSDTAMDYYHKLKQRVIQEYGAENVSDTYSFFTP